MDHEAGVRCCSSERKGPIPKAMPQAEAIEKTNFDFFTADHAQQAYANEQEIIRTWRPMLGKEEKET